MEKTPLGEGLKVEVKPRKSHQHEATEEEIGRYIFLAFTKADLFRIFGLFFQLLGQWTLLIHSQKEGQTLNRLVRQR